MKKKMFWVLAVACWIALPLLADNRATGRVTCRITDETGVPVEGVTTFVASTASRDAYEGLTDKQGLYSCKMRKIFPPIWGQFKKKGYYTTQGHVWNGGFGIVPAETLEITLKRIIDPVPMEKREVRLLFPELEKPIGFDFEVGDWVAPHGKGKLADIFITGTYEENKEQETFAYTATLSVSNVHDGFIPFKVVRMSSDTPAHSALQVPQVVPDEGYQPEIEAYKKRLSQNGVWEDSCNTGNDYYFRLRSIVDDYGKVMASNVGWFYDGTRTTDNDRYDSNNPATRLRITMFYYWNPDPTSHSLEPKEIADRQGVD